ncbi:MAG TPA: hypothetical protein VGR47_15925 [Terracidiphilus sp.]|nr:hypothetical protein [Terracidiphilus sp.]
MSRRFLTFALGAAVAAGMAFVPLSQTSAQTNSNQPKEGSVNDRRGDQQQRIANGVQSGQMTAGETKRIEGREANVNREIHADRTANGGKLTAQERRQVNRQQNNISKSIYTDKHNASQAHFGKNEVGQRRENQQDRIANGIRNGSMTAGEAAHAENRQQNVNRHIATDRAANGGRLTPQERHNINRRQNGSSRQIYRQKHNGRNAPK